MKKPDSLRAKLMEIFPELTRDPHRLRMWIEKGAVKCRAADPAQGENLSYRLDYTLTVVIEEWTRPSLLIWIVLLDWLRIHEPALLTAANGRGLEFEADLISNAKADISLDLPLSEAVIATRRADGGFDMQVKEEPDPLMPDTMPIVAGGERLKAIWLDGTQLVPDPLAAERA
ncbi:hypothetical protein SZ64_07905 [Erythrobacter sp. SG61-1L]|uniref:phage tail protein n=1 Tax=Erythrobacter sp. SG61-1L TaxID=1603897 RepID=UPI0006C92F79|nr:phage tail protein [Erythrobacter sp. SG61-1L]KPL68050.1 hypothetical protein SZ64_07905 [Erythrobacter sp. SG61-1L]